MLGENETKRSRKEDEKEKEEEDGFRLREKRRRHSGEEMVVMRRKRSRHEEKILRSPAELGTMERWRSSRREKARDLEFSGSEDEAMRQRVRMEKGGLERDVEIMRHIGEVEDGQERYTIFLPEHFLLFLLVSFLNFLLL